DSFAQQYCPVVADLGLEYSWSIMQAEYATDLIFKRQQTLQAFYPHLLETLIQAVKPADIATFLGRKMHGNYQGEMGNRFNERWLGTRIKHHMGPVAIKMYDKFNIVLRLETTTVDVSFFKQYRQVQHQDGTTTTKWAPMKKTIYSLPALKEALLAANQRYLKFISEVETPKVGVQKLHLLTETKTENDRRYKGFNLLSEEDASFFRLLTRGEFFISGFTNKSIRRHLPHKNSGQVSRLLKRLRVHRLIKKVGRRYKYYLTEFGRQVVMMALKLREMVIIPELAYGQAVQA
ncbi:MAG: MarR family transcriptional regulator, partial [Anaerolineae bacterium]|nr:MarR family transcriptional regulator [Anaerolineae bacterium]